MYKVLLMLSGVVLFNSTLSAQSVNETFTIGGWEVTGLKNVAHIPAEQEEAVATVKQAFQKAVFTFGDDHNFSLDFEFEEMNMKDVHWRYNETNQSFLIQEWEHKDTDQYLLMEIYVRTDGGNVYFFLDELPFMLIVSRQ